MSTTGIMKCFDAKVKKGETVIMTEENLTSTSIEKAADESEIRNGSDNGIWGVFNSNDKLTITMESNVISLQRLQLLAGVEPTTNPTEIVIKEGQYPTTVELELDSVFINDKGEVEKLVKVSIPKAKPSATWSLATSSSYTDGNSSTVTFTAQKDSTGNLGYIRFTNPTTSTAE